MEDLSFMRKDSLGFVEQSPTLVVSDRGILELRILLVSLATYLRLSNFSICSVYVEFCFHLAELSKVK